jgi:hypothetical protein
MGELLAQIDTSQTKLTLQQKDDHGAINGMKKESPKESNVKKAEKGNKCYRRQF